MSECRRDEKRYKKRYTAYIRTLSSRITRQLHVIEGEQCQENKSELSFCTSLTEVTQKLLGRTSEALSDESSEHEFRALHGQSVFD